jgi:hypothetical protein
MELYKSEIIKDLQNAVNQGFYQLNSYEDYDFLTYGNGLYSNGIRITLRVDPSTGRREAELTIKDNNIGHDFISQWRDTAIGKFFIKDWKKETKDIMGNVPYYTITYTLDNGVKMQGIIRLVVEYYMTELSEDELKEIHKKYADIKIDNRYFSVIKLWKASDPAGHFATTNFGTIITTEDDEENYESDAYITEIEEDPQQEAENISEVLF